MSGAALWDYAVATYARPGVEAALVALQDAHGQSAPLLLWALWLAAAGRWPSPQTLAKAAALARLWEAQATGPLRALRRRLKDAPPDAMEAARGALREKAKALELDAERALLEALEALASLPDDSGEGGPAVLARAAAAYGRAPPAALLERLAGLAA